MQVVRVLPTAEQKVKKPDSISVDYCYYYYYRTETETSKYTCAVEAIKVISAILRTTTNELIFALYSVSRQAAQQLQRHGQHELQQQQQLEQRKQHHHHT